MTANEQPNVLARFATANVAELIPHTQVVEQAGMPPLSPAMREQLADQIQNHGDTDPLVLWHDAVIDGVERLEIYKTLGIERCTTVTLVLPDFDAAVEHRVARNLVRRHLNKWQRCCLVHRSLLPLFSEKQPAGSGDKYENCAALANVGKDTFANALYILKNLEDCYTGAALDEVRSRLEDGRKTIHAVAQDLKHLRKRRSKSIQFGKKASVNHAPVSQADTTSCSPGGFQENSILHDDWIRGLKTVPEGEATLCATSIPYLGSGYTYGGIFNDCARYQYYLDWLEEGFAEVFRTLRDGGMLAINYDSCTTRKNEDINDHRFPLHADLIAISRRLGFSYFGEFIWYKRHAAGRMANHGPRGSLRLRYNHEYIILLSKGTHRLTNETNAKMDISDSEMCEWTLSTWHISAERKHRGRAKHPATFPEEIPTRLIKMFSYKGDLVVDPFCGTGTTCAAARACGRRWFGIDLNEETVEYARRRVENSAEAA